MSSPAPPDSAAADAAVPRASIYWGLLKILIGFAPGFALVDAYVGYLDREQGELEKQGAWIKDEQLGWRPEPFFENPDLDTRLDRYGLRNAEIPEDADPREIRVMGFGASRTYGAGGVSQKVIWNVFLDEMFARDPKVDVDVRFLNGGVMGYSAVQACRRASLMMDEIRPDLVFVTISPGAQMMLDPSASREWVRVGTELVQADVIEGWPEWAHPWVAKGHRLLQHSNIYVRHRAKFEIAVGNEENSDRESSIQRWVLSRQEPSPAAAAMLERTWAEVAALGALAKERGIELRILVLPEHYQDDPVRWDRFLKSSGSQGAPPIGTPRNEPTEVLREKCQELGIATWVFDPEVREVGTDRARYMAKDNFHWSAEGHGIIARGIARRLRKGGLLNTLIERRAADPR